MKALKKLLQDLADVDFTSINQIRMEVRVNGSYTFSQALAISDGMYQKMNFQKVCCKRIRKKRLKRWKKKLTVMLGFEVNPDLKPPRRYTYLLDILLYVLLCIPLLGWRNCVVFNSQQAGVTYIRVCDW